MTVRKLLVTDIRCRTCDAPPGVDCRRILVTNSNGNGVVLSDGTHGERLAEHAELERAGWQWQEVNPLDRGRR